MALVRLYDFTTDYGNKTPIDDRKIEAEFDQIISVLTGGTAADKLIVDNIQIDGNTISSIAGTDLNIIPLAGQQLLLDTDVIIDAGVITGVKSLTLDNGASDVVLTLSKSGTPRWLLRSDNSATSDFHITTGGGTIRLEIDQTTGNIGFGISPTANMTGLALEGGVLTIKEITTPTQDAAYGKVYCKSDNKLYFQDGAGVEHEIAYA